MQKTINLVGFRSGIFAFGFAAAYSIIQILQVLKIIGAPIDAILIYGTSLGIVIPFILEILALHYVTSPEKKFWSHAALIFTIYMLYL